MTATLPYLEFRTALAKYQQPLTQLSMEARAAIHAQALQQWQLEECILESPQASSCHVDEASLAQALAQIRTRYPDHDSYLSDLAANELNEMLLVQALERELRVEAILAWVAAQVPRVTEQEAENFYWQHRERFEIRAARQARHILITINEALPGNGREQSLAKIEAIAAELAAGHSLFADQALRHSECPTALNGGELGWVARGQLYPELDAALFSLPPGGISTVQESAMGFHLLQCEAVREAGMQAFSDVLGKLVDALQKLREKRAQTAWLKGLAAG